MKKISDAELEVLKVIWDKNIVTSLDIIYELRRYNWSNNTVRTLIKRLYQKGAIEILKKEGKRYIIVTSYDEKDGVLDVYGDYDKHHFTEAGIGFRGNGTSYSITQDFGYSPKIQDPGNLFYGWAKCY